MELTITFALRLAHLSKTVEKLLQLTHAFSVDCSVSSLPLSSVGVCERKGRVDEYHRRSESLQRLSTDDAPLRGFRGSALSQLLLVQRAFVIAK